MDVGGSTGVPNACMPRKYKAGLRNFSTLLYAEYAIYDRSQPLDSICIDRECVPHVLCVVLQVLAWYMYVYTHIHTEKLVTSCVVWITMYTCQCAASHAE